MAGYLIDANLPRWFSLWADGNCQGHGQFFLARRNGRWVVID